MPTPFPPSTIKTWQYSSTKGGLEKNLKLNASAPVPKPKPDQHLVQVIAVALNPVDYKPAEVPIFGRLVVSKPATPGIDFVGCMVQPATGSSLKPGQLVFGAAGTGSPFAAGGLSEFAISTKQATVPVPDGLDPISAATIGVAGLTAYQSIVPHVKKGDSVFLNGGSGGTGVFGIQIAKALGCHVTTSCSTPNVELCKSLGADEVVDYRKHKSVVEALKTSGRTFDHVVDNVGADYDLYWRCHQYTKPDAKYVMVAGTPSLSFVWNSLKVKFLPAFLGGGKRKMLSFFAEPRYAELERIGNWMRDGETKPVVDQLFSYEQAPQAFEKLKTGRARGKIVIDVASQTYRDVWTK